MFTRLFLCLCFLELALEIFVFMVLDTIYLLPRDWSKIWYKSISDRMTILEDTELGD